jgi:MSHA biogenesis protein MshK
MLQSIVCRDAGLCRAVLNNQVALVGETVNGYKVTSIEPELVWLSRAGKQWELELFTLDIKQ